MGNSIERIEQKLKGDLGQNWKDADNHTIYRDQFGNEIHKTRNGYILYRKQEKIIEVNKLHTAKLISQIIVNDTIHYKDLGNAH